MARATIVVGLNQTIMAALSMATLAAFVDGPGLGKSGPRARCNASTSAARSCPVRSSW